MIANKCAPIMSQLREIKEYYEEEALVLNDHQKEMYFGDPWNTYRHDTRLQLILDLIEDISFSSFLDVGCAEGFYIGLLSRNFGSSESFGMGLDIAKNYLLKAKGIMPNSSLIVGDSHKLPFKKNVFELIFCSEVLEHVLNPEAVLKELVRVSKKYVLVTVAGENFFYFFARKLGLVKPEDPYAKFGHGHINEVKMYRTVIPWAVDARCKSLYSKVICYFPISFLQKHRMPTFFIPIIKFADKLMNKIPIIREFASVQIVLLQKQSF